jgi:hypothetical protein
VNPIKYPNGDIEIMKDTPMVELLVRGREVKGSLDKKYDRSVYLNEKQPVIITNLFPEKYPHIVKCQLITVIPENYKDQYLITSPEKEDAPEEMNPEIAATPSPEVVSDANPTMEETTGPTP